MSVMARQIFFCWCFFGAARLISGRICAGNLGNGWLVVAMSLMNFQTKTKSLISVVAESTLQAALLVGRVVTTT